MPDIRYRWLTEEEGGRKTLPIGPALRIPIRLHSRVDEYARSAWDVIFQFECPPVAGKEQSGSIRYAREIAPHEFLASGELFDLMEGRRIVVTGEVI
jgi:hypothetical protein